MTGSQQCSSAVWAQTELHDHIVKAKELLEGAYRHLTEHEMQQREFVNLAAHELPTPVQPLLAMAETIGQRMDTQRRRWHNISIEKSELDRIIRNANRLEKLTNDLLAVTRIVNGTFRLNMERFNLQGVVTETVIDHSKDQINPLKVEMRYDDEKEIMVKSDKDKVAEVLYNPLDNAGKFTDNGMISINTEQQDDMGVVSFRDTGGGIEILKSWTGFLQNLPQKRTTVLGWGFTYQRQ
jgi:signal transduction histidine kinase